ncbi:hypothetical protein C7M84_024133 [Penaeus vannamei]|uniref:Uncharacterized protein n=1 Tax=Penaeus vannamei TaxID=6689 RepID=A0A3R7MIN2_PENVA|nr:hypothetical protein C7M84_024133 [Penaeus vannamei]
MARFPVVLPGSLRSGRIKDMVQSVVLPGPYAVVESRTWFNYPWFFPVLTQCRIKDMVQLSVVLPGSLRSGRIKDMVQLSVVLPGSLRSGRIKDMVQLSVVLPGSLRQWSNQGHGSIIRDAVVESRTWFNYPWFFRSLRVVESRTWFNYPCSSRSLRSGRIKDMVQLSVVLPGSLRSGRIKDMVQLSVVLSREWSNQGHGSIIRFFRVLTQWSNQDMVQLSVVLPGSLRSGRVKDMVQLSVVLPGSLRSGRIKDMVQLSVVLPGSLRSGRIKDMVQLSARGLTSGRIKDMVQLSVVLPGPYAVVESRDMVQLSVVLPGSYAVVESRTWFNYPWFFRVLTQWSNQGHGSIIVVRPYAVRITWFSGSLLTQLVESRAWFNYPVLPGPYAVVESRDWFNYPWFFPGPYAWGIIRLNITSRRLDIYWIQDEGEKRNPEVSLWTSLRFTADIHGWFGF